MSAVEAVHLRIVTLERLVQQSEATRGVLRNLPHNAHRDELLIANQETMTRIALKLAAAREQLTELEKLETKPAGVRKKRAGK